MTSSWREMCECSKRHLQRNGGQLASSNNIVVGATSAEHVNGYIKHVMRHHKGRGGGNCPLINRTATTTPVRHHHHQPHPTNKNVSSILLSIWFHQPTFFLVGGDRSKFKWLPHLRFIQSIPPVLFFFFHFIPSFILLSTYSGDYVTFKGEIETMTIRPGTGNSNFLFRVYFFFLSCCVVVVASVSTTPTWPAVKGIPGVSVVSHLHNDLLHVALFFSFLSSSFIV